jgi:hypothetical protein
MQAFDFMDANSCPINPDIRDEAQANRLDALKHFYDNLTKFSQ